MLWGRKMRKIIRLDLLAEGQKAKVIENCATCFLNIRGADDWDRCMLGVIISQSYHTQLEGFPKGCPLPDYIEQENSK